MAEGGSGTVPLLRDVDAHPPKRNFMPVVDLSSALPASPDNPRAKRRRFDLCKDRPVDQGKLGASVARARRVSI
jgi:UDP-glucose 4-epimerase